MHAAYPCHPDRSPSALRREGEWKDPEDANDLHAASGSSLHTWTFHGARRSSAPFMHTIHLCHPDRSPSALRREGEWKDPEDANDLHAASGSSLQSAFCAALLRSSLVGLSTC